jgi:hypothetical protein
MTKSQRIDNIVIGDDVKKIYLQSNDFSVVFKENQLDLIINNNEICDIISKMKNPKISFRLNSEECVAVGNFIFSPTLPNDFGYYFSLDERGAIFFYRDNMILIKKHDE